MQKDGFTLAIAGFGWWGRHIATRLKGHTDIGVAGVIDPNPAQRTEIEKAGLRAFETLDEVLALPEVDAVVLTTPNPMHEEQVIACARAGKHV